MWILGWRGLEGRDKKGGGLWREGKRGGEGTGGIVDAGGLEWSGSLRRGREGPKRIGTKEDGK